MPVRQHAAPSYSRAQQRLRAFGHTATPGVQINVQRHSLQPRFRLRHRVAVLPGPLGRGQPAYDTDDNVERALPFIMKGEDHQPKQQGHNTAGITKGGAGEKFRGHVPVGPGPEEHAESDNQIEHAQKMSDGSVTQRSAGNDQRSWKVNWTAPADDTKELTFDLWVNAVNGDGSNNADDDWNTVEKKVKGANYTPASDPDGDDSPGLGLLMVMTATMMAVAGTCLIRNRK